MFARVRQRRQSSSADGDGRDVTPPEPAELRMQAIRLLARRDHSRSELRQKLSRSGSDAAAVETLLDTLEGERLLSDLRFAQGVARTRGARYGSQRVANDLRQRGVGADESAGLIADLKAGDLELARTLWERKFGVSPVSQSDRAKQMRFLQARGFPGDVIRRVVPRMAAAADED